MEHARLASLTSEYVAGTLSAAGNEELYLFLLSSSTAREQFDRLVLSYWVANPEIVVHTATEFLEKYVPGAKVIPLTGETADGADSASLFRASMRSWRAWSLGGALAACVTAALVIAFHSTTSPTPFAVPHELSSEPVATLQHAANVQWLNLTNEIFLGHSFGATELNATSGVFQLEFRRGARLVVKAPARLQLVSDNEAFLHFGSVTAFVPDEAQGFKVTSPMTSVTDLGTEFGLAALPGGRADVHVFTGIVEVDRPSASPKRMVEGEAVRVQGRRVKNAIVNRNAFVFEDEVRALEREEQRGRLAEWRKAAHGLSQDPATLVHYTFEAQDEFGTQLSNCAARPPKGTTATVAGTWGTGRWPEKRGFTFGTANDRIRFNVPNTITSLTYMAWLRVDALNNVSNALAITESGKLGEVHWQIYRDGRVALSSHSGKAGNVDETWDRGLSPPLFTPDRLGKWTHLTSVYDSVTLTIRHYLNGEFVSSTPIKRLLPLNLGYVEVANWGLRDRSGQRSSSEYFSRFWSGGIDEFALLARAMTAEEVREYYRNGRVAAGYMVVQK